MKEIINKLVNGKELTTNELKTIVWDWPHYDELRGENRRWSQTVTVIFKVGEELYALDYEHGLTELQDHEYWSQPYKVEEILELVPKRRYEPL